MSEFCALEIMQKNNMIKVNEGRWVYKITTNEDPNEEDIIKEIELPYKIIRFKTAGENFNKKFRELMKKSGYICTPASNYGDSDKFVKKSDITNFIKELPEIETIYLKELCWFVEQYIKKWYSYLKIKKINNRYKRNLFENCNTIIKLTNTKIKENRIEQARKKEQEAIEFMEQLFI